MSDQPPRGNPLPSDDLEDPQHPTNNNNFSYTPTVNPINTIIAISGARLPQQQQNPTTQNGFDIRPTLVQRGYDIPEVGNVPLPQEGQFGSRTHGVNMPSYTSCSTQFGNFGVNVPSSAQFSGVNVPASSQFSGPGSGSGFGAPADVSVNPNDSMAGIQTQRPRHPEYSILATRLATFDGWSPQIAQRPNELAKAGLYYLGRYLQDCTRKHTTCTHACTGTHTCTVIQLYL
jgi:hypothetical protein